MATVLLVGTLDTKRDEYRWIQERLRSCGVDTFTADVGSFSEEHADVTAAEVAGAVGVNVEELRESRDRGAMMSAMAEGIAVVARRLADAGRIHAVLSVAGSGGSSVAASAMQALPIGFPKLLVSTMASGDVKPYIGEVDAAVMYSVVDVAGINQISGMVFDNACVSIAAQARHHEERLQGQRPDEYRPMVGITMFGVTTPAADEARVTLEGLGYEPLVFHATGSGGRSMEKLVESGLLAGVVDLTTTELADELVGGVLSAGPRRLEMAAKCGVPQVVSVGALDMVNFGPPETIPERFDKRQFLVHNPSVTLMRTTAAENAELGRIIASKLVAGSGPTTMIIPRNGVSTVDVEGGPFRDEAADEALFDALRTGLSGSAVTLVEVEQALNDPGVGADMAHRLHESITNRPNINTHNTSEEKQS